MSNPLLSYLKNNEDIFQNNKYLTKDSLKYEFKIPYVNKFYSYINNSLFAWKLPEKSSKPDLLARPDRDTTRFDIYLYHRSGINKYKTNDYRLGKKEFKEKKKFKELFAQNVQHYFKNNYN